MPEQSIRRGQIAKGGVNEEMGKVIGGLVSVVETVMRNTE